MFIEYFQMEIAEEIRKIAVSKLLNPHHFVVDVVVSARKGPKKVLITLDGDDGVNIDDCANLSREIGKALEESNLMDEAYMLEVSTPGVDQPLQLHRQYKKHIGRKLKLKLRDKIVEGKLTEVADDKIAVIQETGTGKQKATVVLDIPFSEIEKSFVLVSFK